MPALRLITGGESHGKMLTAILEGFPAGLRYDRDRINAELAARQMGYGRSGRQRLEQDCINVTGGIRHGITTGAPLVLHIENRDHENWHHVMAAHEPDQSDAAVLAQLQAKKIERFRPGHADYAGTIKYGHNDIRDVLERASARETAARVAAGASALLLLEALDIEVASHVLAIGAITAAPTEEDRASLRALENRARDNELFCVDEPASAAMKDNIKQALMDGDSLGGIIEILADGLPVGLGTYTQWDRRLDGLLAQALMSIQAIKAIEVGDGIAAAGRRGSQVHDALYPRHQEEDQALPARRMSNHAGGLEGGMTNGERLILRAYMKPIPTLKAGLDSLSYPQFEASRAHFERSDVCAVPAASVVAKAMVCLTLANSVLDKFAADSMLELSSSLKNYRLNCRQLPRS